MKTFRQFCRCTTEAMRERGRPPSLDAIRQAWPRVAGLSRYSNTFILPDGTVLRLAGIDHAEACNRAGWTLTDVIALGVIRQRGDGIQARTMTDIQARVITDFYNTTGWTTLFVDRVGYSRAFDTPINASALRNYVNGTATSESISLDNSPDVLVDSSPMDVKPVGFTGTSIRVGGDVEIREFISGYAYPRNGNVDRPTPTRLWVLTHKGKIVDQFHTLRDAKVAARALSSL